MVSAHVLHMVNTPPQCACSENLLRKLGKDLHVVLFQWKLGGQQVQWSVVCALWVCGHL